MVADGAKPEREDGVRTTQQKILGSNPVSAIFIKGVLGSAGLRVAGMAVTFLVGVQLARYLGPAGYGTYGIVTAMVAIASVVAGLGIPPMSTREAAIADQRQDWPYLKGLLTWAPLSVGGAALGLAALGALIFHAFPSVGIDDKTAMTVGLFLLPVYALAMLCGALMRGLGAIVGGQTLDVLMRPIFLCALLLMAAGSSGTLSASTALSMQLLASSLALAIGAIWLATCVPKPVVPAARQMRVRQWLRSSVPMGGTELLRTLDSHGIVLIVGVVVTTTELGLFRVALSSVGLIALPYALMSVVAAPTAARLHAQGDKQGLQHLLRVASLVMVLTTTLTTLVLWFFGQFLVSFLFGADFIGAWPILMVFSVAQLINAAFGLAPMLLNATGHETLLMKAFLASVTTSLVAAVVLGTMFGPIGGACAYLVGTLVRGIPLQIAAVARLDIQPAIIPLRWMSRFFGRH